MPAQALGKTTAPDIFGEAGQRRGARSPGVYLTEDLTSTLLEGVRTRAVADDRGIHRSARREHRKAERRHCRILARWG